MKGFSSARKNRPLPFSPLPLTGSHKMRRWGWRVEGAADCASVATRAMERTTCFSVSREEDNQSLLYLPQFICRVLTPHRLEYIYIYIFSLISLHLWYVSPEELSLWKFFGSIDALIGRDATIRWKVMRVWREERKRIHSFPLKCLIDRGFIVTFFSSEKRKN